MLWLCGHGHDPHAYLGRVHTRFPSSIALLCAYWQAYCTAGGRAGRQAGRLQSRWVGRQAGRHACRQTGRLSYRQCGWLADRRAGSIACVDKVKSLCWVQIQSCTMIVATWLAVHTPWFSTNWLLRIYRPFRVAFTFPFFVIYRSFS